MSDGLGDLRQRIDALDVRIEELVRERDRLATDAIRAKGTPVYDPRREREIARGDEALWLPLLRRVRTAEAARAEGPPRRAAALAGGGFAVVACVRGGEADLERTLLELREAQVRFVRVDPGQAGAARARVLADRCGLQLVLDVTGEGDVARLSEHADVLCVDAGAGHGAPLLEALARAGRPVLLERGAARTVEEWLADALRIAEGAPVALCERGVRSFDPCFAHQLDLAGAVLARRLGGFQTLVDPARATGVAGLVPPLARAARAAGLDGAVVAVRPREAGDARPDAAALTAEELGRLLSQVAVPGA